MDALSVTSTTVNLLGLSIQVLGALCRRWNEGGRQSSERLTHEVNLIRNSLEALEKVASRREVIVMDNSLPTALEHARENIAALLFALVEDPLVYRPPWLMHVGNDAEFPLNKRTVDMHVDAIFSCHTAVREALERVPSLRSSNANMTLSKLDGPRNRLWSMRAEYETAHDLARSKRAEGTGIWLLQDSRFTDWLRIDRTPFSFYCLGSSGVGKSTLTSMVIESIQERYVSRSDIAMAYFYFQYYTSTSILGVALALLEQLYRACPTFPEEVLALEEAAESGDINLGDVMLVLLAVARRFRKCFFAIDALDECSFKQQQELVSFIEYLSSSGCRLFLTSRPVVGLEREFRWACVMNVTAHEDDIGKVVLDSIKSNKALRDLDDEIKDEISHHIIKKSNGNFLWTNLALQSLVWSRSVPEAHQTIERMPSSLVTIHSLNLQHIEGEDRTLCKNTLTWLYYAQRPLTAAELADVLPGGSIQRALNACAGFATMNSADGTVVFTHLSVRDYLASESTNDSLTGAIFPETFITHSCLSVLTAKQTDRAIYGYAASSWGLHLRSITSNPPSAELVKHFLHNSEAVQASAEYALGRQAGLQGELNEIMEEHPAMAIHLIAYFGLYRVLESSSVLVNTHSLWPLNTALQISVARGHTEVVELLLRHGAYPGERVRTGKNAYHRSAINGDRQIMLMLCKAPDTDKNIICRDASGMTPFDYAARQGSSNVLSTLLEQFDSHRWKHDLLSRSLQYSIIGGNFECVRLLVQAGIDVEASHLAAAVGLGFSEAVLLFLELGADLNTQVPKYGSLLHAAIDGDKHVVLEMLVANGASLETINANGQTPLAYAVYRSRASAVRLLLSGGAAVDVAVHPGESVARHAQRQNYQEIVKLLQYAGADLDHRLSTRSQRADASAAMQFGGRDEDGESIVLDSQDGEECVQIHDEEGITVIAGPHAARGSHTTPTSTPSSTPVASPSDTKTIDYYDTSRSGERRSQLDTGESTAPAAFLTLSKPTSPELLPLGTIVLDPAMPLESYFPKADRSAELRALLEKYSQISTTVEQDFALTTTHAPSGDLGALFKTKHHRRSRSTRLKAPICTRETIVDHKSVAKKIVSALGREFMQAMGAPKVFYVIVGRMVLADAEIINQSSVSKLMGIFGSTAGIPVEPSSGVFDLHYGSAAERIEATGTGYPGQMLYALQYVRFFAKSPLLVEDRQVASQASF